MSECVDHFEDGRNAWQIGALGFFSRLRGFLITVLITIISMGTPFWWPEHFKSTRIIEMKSVFLVLVFLFSLIFCASFFYLRLRTIRSLDIKFYLHSLSHFLRDYQTKICKRRHSHQKRNEKHEIKFLRKFTGKICDHLKDYYIRLLKDDSIEVAIRLAKEKDIEGVNKITYYTIARSSGFNKNRYKTSEAICSDEGIPSFFLKKKEQGILIFNDLERASKQEFYKKTKNDDQYPDEVKTMMVAPLNGYDGQGISMIGLLHITSRKKNTFNITHVDSLKFTADLIAKSICHAVNNL
ncbi:hypothetical protein UWK_00853 [Desulfocapsa sulfexigens DSM 10523]|uniref:Uncharacterized protein n=1 Tax=Desulfocapsa sulfexigens (strain DSM 10523 / SB164P1) TaxID=1167006 RepID=M1P6V6_DESSD|nr:hypothetical protein [Desulfocapsa sulfexigens]AGF77427.1 hypothetical protein UWK_00853 [Desulfocapsa sulfexigens DSM 10523]